MDFAELSREGWALVQEHWRQAILPLAGLIFGWWWGRRRAAREWAKKQFLSRLNVSLNTLEPLPDLSGNDSETTSPPKSMHVLRVRTLSEKDMEAVFLNRIAAERLQAAAGRTTADDPLIPLRDDAWFMLNAVLNELSEQFAVAHLKKDLRQPVTTAIYLIALTYECAGALRTRKVRAMVMRKDALLALDATAPEPQYEHPNHATRYRTLLQLATGYRRDPSQFLEVELGV